jgi:dTDP-4-dehydrorhamnose 3,5-epimerase
VFDVIVDLSARQWFGIELTQDNHRMLFIPEGIAHGFQTLADATEVSYQISRAYQESAAAGVRWNDPVLRIAWPLEPTVMSERDRILPELS